MPDRESLLDRFCRYVRIDTQSSATSTTYPSTEKQKDLLRVLVDDLKIVPTLDEWGILPLAVVLSLGATAFALLRWVPRATPSEQLSVSNEPLAKATH